MIGRNPRLGSDLAQGVARLYHVGSAAGLILSSEITAWVREVACPVTTAGLRKSWLLREPLRKTRLLHRSLRNPRLLGHSLRQSRLLRRSLQKIRPPRGFLRGTRLLCYPL
jgi:hypothetical protein